MRSPAACSASALLLAAGCGPEPVRHDIEFARGCWVEKIEPGGQIVAFLRLLPDRDGAATLAGHLDYIDPDAGDGVSDDGRDDMIYTLSLDGSMLTTQLARKAGYQDQYEQDKWPTTDIPAAAGRQPQPDEGLAAFQDLDAQWAISAETAASLATEWPATDLPAVAMEQRQPGESLAAFRELNAQWTIFVGGNDTLAIYTLAPDGQMGTTLFSGERDGCD